jgi:hypothetical protein
MSTRVRHDIEQFSACIEPLYQAVGDPTGWKNIAQHSGRALPAAPDAGTAAARTSISRNTVKSHLKQVFAKTGCTRQSDLVRDLGADPILKMAASVKRPPRMA